MGMGRRVDPCSIYEIYFDAAHTITTIDRQPPKAPCVGSHLPPALTRVAEGSAEGPEHDAVDRWVEMDAASSIWQTGDGGGGGGGGGVTTAAALPEDVLF